MTNADFKRFLELPEQDRKDVFAARAENLSSKPSHVEKDFWVCLVLDALFNGLPDEHPDLLFKGGTSLSKAFGLVNRFSEDVDLVVYRGDLGFGGDKDPTAAKDIPNKKRKTLFDELKGACSNYILGDLSKELKSLLGDYCKIVPDPDDPDQQTLLIKFTTLYPDEDTYIRPEVKIEAGARSALNPNTIETVEPYIAGELDSEWDFKVPNINTIEPGRTYLDKIILMHGIHCGFRDEERKPKEGARISRHYYDAAMMTGTSVGGAALSDRELLEDARAHSEVSFKRAWMKLEEAVPGTIRIVPQEELVQVLKADYLAMQGMMFGEAPDFEWVLEQIRTAEKAINEQV